MKPLQLLQVNAALKKAGAAEVLVRGKGYYYFMDGDAHKWLNPTVCVYSVAQLSIEQWIEEWRSLRSEWLKRKGEA